MMLKGKKWSLKQQSMVTVEAVNIKRKKEIKPSSQSKVPGMKWNL
jgi:hypothetical protein